jgi:hypothetical protein
MYPRITQRPNRNGSTVALAEYAWNAAIKRAEAQTAQPRGDG